MQGDLDREFANGLELAIGQTHLRLLDAFETGLLQTFGDVGVGDRAEQATVDAGLLGDLQLEAVDALAQGLGSGQLLGLDLFQFSAAGFEFLQAASVARRAFFWGIRKLRA